MQILNHKYNGSNIQRDDPSLSFYAELKNKRFIREKRKGRREKRKAGLASFFSLLSSSFFLLSHQRGGFPHQVRRLILASAIAFSSVLFCFEPVLADARGSEVVEKLQKKFKGLKTLSARFTKQFYWRLMEQHQEVKGKLVVQRPDRFRFDSDAQVVVTDGKTAWNYAPANAQVMISDYATVDKNRSHEKLLFDLILLGGYDDSYVPVYVGEEKIDRKTCYVVDLTTKKEDTYVHTIRLWIDKGLYLVRQVEYRNIHEDVTTFALSDLKVDKKISAEQFTFQAPKGVELIDLR